MEERDEQGRNEVSPAANNALSIGGIVCGVASIIVAFFSPIFGVMAGVVAIVLATSFIQRSGKTTQSVAARYCGIAGIVLSVLVYVFVLVGLLTQT